MQDFVIINQHKFPTLLAINEVEQRRGLMFETKPKIMSFIYPEQRFNSFWMHQTPLPLDIVFAANGKIVAVENGIPFSTSLIGGQNPSDLVVELPAGTTKELGIKVGDPIQIQYSRLTLDRLAKEQFLWRIR